MIKLIDAENTVVLMIDIQEKLLNAVYNKEILEKNAVILTKATNILDIPLIITEQYPKGLGETIANIKDGNDKIKFFEKTSFSAMENIELKKTLDDLNIQNVVLCGIETHICVYQTAISLLNSGYSVLIIKNACGSRNENETNTALSSLQNMGARIVTTEIALFELLKTSKHPKFKELQNLIK